MVHNNIMFKQVGQAQRHANTQVMYSDNPNPSHTKDTFHCLLPDHYAMKSA